MIEQVEYMGIGCQRLTNGAVEAIVTTAVGPRILRYALAGGENILAELPDPVMKTALGEWKVLGGHRLWTAPEGMPRSYAARQQPRPGFLPLVPTLQRGDAGSWTLRRPSSRCRGQRGKARRDAERPRQGITPRSGATRERDFRASVSPSPFSRRRAFRRK